MLRMSNCGWESISPVAGILEESDVEYAMVPEIHSFTNNNIVSTIEFYLKNGSLNVARMHILIDLSIY